MQYWHASSRLCASSRLSSSGASSRMMAAMMFMVAALTACMSAGALVLAVGAEPAAGRPASCS